jgi:hypothetical protein
MLCHVHNALIELRGMQMNVKVVMDDYDLSGEKKLTIKFQIYVLIVSSA